MKKYLLPILALLTLFLFASCDNTGVFDSVWNDEQISNENIITVLGRTSAADSKIYYISEVNGLTSYDTSTKERVILNNDISLRRSRGAAFDTTGKYVVSYYYESVVSSSDKGKIHFCIVSLDDPTSLTPADTITGLESTNLREGFGSLLYSLDGVYSVTVTAGETVTATATQVSGVTDINTIFTNSGVYAKLTDSSANNIYYTSPSGEGTASSYSQASFPGLTDNDATVSFITATPDHEYVFFYKTVNSNSSIVIYHYDGNAYTALSESITGETFTSAAESRAVEYGNRLVLIRGSKALLIDSTSGAEIASSENTSISYEFIKGIVPNTDGTFTIVTRNKGIHTMTVTESNTSFV